MKLKLPGHADGGIFTDPHIAAFCENGMESVIPIDGSANALSLWEKTGQLLGLSFNIENRVVAMQYLCGSKVRIL